MKGFFITGTDTGVGKTEVAACLAGCFLRKGFKVAVMKPVATGVRRTCSDARILKTAARSNAPLNRINPVALRYPLAPLTAKRLEKKKIDLNIIWRNFRKLKSASDVVIVEGIGGLMTPIKKTGRTVFYVRDMILKMGLPVILVTRPDLGTINHTLMTIGMLRARGIKIAGVIINYTSHVKKDLAVKTNPSVIEELSGIKVLGVMYYNKDRKRRRIRWSGKTGF
ncbi:MAG: dethiobiotin synthase [Candidatus Omnitrophica bacterium]|nr:dethiobiotin synthase [Candidatus Omnitrophota bacterium]MBU4149343.1 dethiobiotin synthase [Candidatus Omnitrophota bacterium]